MCRRMIFLVSFVLVLVLVLTNFAQADLIGYWEFEESSGIIAADSVDGDNDGILFGEQLEWTDKTFDGEIPNSDYGFFIISGDIDGDDNSDIIIGADLFRQNTGRAYVYWGSEITGPSTKPGRIFTGENPGEQASQLENHLNSR